MGSTDKGDKKGVRYSEKEKKILYELFKQNEEIIDIKQRKNTQYKLTEVRECWQNILNEFNNYHGVTERNLKQIQKFWLNSRLRTRNSSLDSRKPGSVKRRKSSLIKDESSCNEINDLPQNEQFYSSNNNSRSNDEDIYEEEIRLKEEIEVKVADKFSHDEDSTIEHESIDKVRERKKSSRLHKISRSKRLRNTQIHTVDVTTQTKNKSSTYSSPIISHIHLDDHNDTFESQMNILKLKEYECKIKESQMRCEQQRIDILKAQEDLEHLQEFNRLKIREMQLKIILLEEQTKLRRNRI